MRKPTLIDNWRSAYRWASVQIMGLSGAILATWAAIPETFQKLLPAEYMKAGLAVLLAAGIGGRLIKQSPVKKKRKKRNNTKDKGKLKSADIPRQTETD